MGCLYKLDFPSGKSYIGVTVGRLCNRIAGHRYTAANGKQQAVYNAWRKYGEPLVTLLAEHPADQLAIALYNTRSPHGYNETSGGNLNTTMSDAARAKLSAIAVGRIPSQETRQKMSASSKGRPKTEEHRRRIAAWHTGRPLSDETRAKIAAKAKGRKIREETRIKMSLARKGRKVSLETRAKMARAKLGTKHTPETIAKLTGRVRSAQHNARISAGRLAAFAKRKSSPTDEKRDADQEHTNGQ